MAGLRESKKHAVRKALYDAAVAQIEARGYDAVTVADICKAAGVAKGTFFNHFPSKADIVAAWYLELTSAVTSVQTAAPGAPLPDALTGFVVRTVEIGERTPALWEAKGRLTGRHAGLKEIEQTADAALRAVAASRIEDSRSRGHLPPDTDAAGLADLYVTLVSGCFHEWRVGGQAGDVIGTVRERVRRLCVLAGYPAA